MYTGYRCYYHIYLDGNIFYCILTVKLCYVCYRNSTSLFEYTATKVNANKKESMEERAKIQDFLMHFNSQVGFAYLQLVIMQIYFVVTVLFNLYHNCTFLAFQNSMFIKELTFLVLTICLTLIMHIFSLVWSFDLLKVNKTLFGRLLISLGVFTFSLLYFIVVFFDAF